MKIIENFKKIRRDGKVIDELMSAKEMAALGWSAEKVVEISWKAGTNTAFRRKESGLLAIVVPGREFIAAIEEVDEGEESARLMVINADGTLRVLLPNKQLIDGKSQNGVFEWFEPPRDSSPNVFGVVFKRLPDRSIYQLDIDASTANCVGIYSIR